VIQIQRWADQEYCSQASRWTLAFRTKMPPSSFDGQQHCIRRNRGWTPCHATPACSALQDVLCIPTPCLVPLILPKFYYAKRRFPVTSKCR
jgi:hypothetical protein